MSETSYSPAITRQRSTTIAGIGRLPVAHRSTVRGSRHVSSANPCCVSPSTAMARRRISTSAGLIARYVTTTFAHLADALDALREAVKPVEAEIAEWCQSSEKPLPASMARLLDCISTLTGVHHA